MKKENLEIALIKNLATIFGCSYVGVRGYVGASGECSNHLVNIGMTYEKAKIKDIEVLKASKFEDEVLESARVKILESMVKNSSDATRSNQSKGQIDAYTYITNGVKMHNETYDLYIFAYEKSKEVLSPATNPKKKSSNPMVIAEYQVKKLLKLQTAKFRTFKFSLLNDVKVKGNVLSFGSGMNIESINE